MAEAASLGKRSQGAMSMEVIPKNNLVLSYPPLKFMWMIWITRIRTSSVDIALVFATLIESISCWSPLIHCPACTWGVINHPESMVYMRFEPRVWVTPEDRGWGYLVWAFDMHILCLVCICVTCGLGCPPYWEYLMWVTNGGKHVQKGHATVSWYYRKLYSRRFGGRKWLDVQGEWKNSYILQRIRSEGTRDKRYKIITL